MAVAKGPPKNPMRGIITIQAKRPPPNITDEILGPMRYPTPPSDGNTFIPMVPKGKPGIAVSMASGNKPKIDCTVLNRNRLFRL